MFSHKGIEDAFGITLTLDPVIVGRQETWRNVALGTAPWNNDDTPSLNLPNAISTRVARKVVPGLKSEISGSERADYLQAQYKDVLAELENAVIAVCDGGEIIFKPYMLTDGLSVTVSETDCYWPIAYDVNDKLIDVVFGAQLKKEKTVYTLLERHTYDESTRTHEIVYRAFKSEQAEREFTPDNMGKPIPVTDVGEWAHLTDIVIHDIENPLFVHFKLPSKDAGKALSRYGAPIWAKSIEMIRKADQQEARTDWEFEGGELAIDASVEMFKPSGTAKGGEKLPPQLPKGKERLYRTLYAQSGDFQMQVFSPHLRIAEHNMRTNDIKRTIEFQCGLSYGQISDAGGQDRTAEEFKASKDNFFSTVSGIQQALQFALDRLIYSFDILADLQGVVQGGYEVSYTWDDSIMADREKEFDERLRGQAAGWLDRVENRAWYLGIDEDSEEATKIQQRIEETQDEFDGVR